MRDTRRSRIVLAILVLVSITLIVFDLRGGDSGPTRPLRAAGETVLGSAERAMATFVLPVRGLFESLGGLGDADARIAQLEADNARLQAELDTVANDRARVADLEALLGLVSTNDYETVPAQVIAVGPAQGFAWTVTIDAGSRDGIERDMSVISGMGLVGRTIDVGPTTSTVLLVVDATSSVGGRLSGTSQIGIVSGTGRQDSLTMQLLDPLAVVDLGDVVVSFGSEGGRPYAPGVPIGVVTEMRGTEGQLTRSAILEPYVDISRLDIVGVVLRAPESPPRETLATTGTGGG
jgi:rod shape-determining protein MreC